MSHPYPPNQHGDLTHPDDQQPTSTQISRSPGQAHQLPPPAHFHAAGHTSGSEYTNVSPYGGPPPLHSYYPAPQLSPGIQLPHHSQTHGPGGPAPGPSTGGGGGSASYLYPPALTYAPQHQSTQARHNNGSNLPLSLPNSPFHDPSQPHLSMSYMQQQAQQHQSYDAQAQHPYSHNHSHSHSQSISYQAQLSPYATPFNGPPLLPMNDYFPPFPPISAQISSQQQQQQQPPPILAQPPFPSSEWQSAPPVAIPPPGGAGSSSTGGGTGKSHGPKTSRQQFTACGACRHRRVKCDLKDRQEQAERQAQLDEDKGVGPIRAGAVKKKKVVCTNCHERGTNCIDEFAPIKAAKQLRRGKRISEIEMLYGRQAAVAAKVAVSEVDRDELVDIEVKKEGIPDLAPEFFESAFFRRFQVQRPILDPNDFVARYLAHPQPSAAAMGREGAVLCHVLYAWAISYGVNERGHLDVPEGGGVAGFPTSLLDPNADELKREGDRQGRWARMQPVVQTILEEIDVCRIMRIPTWDGVRVLLLVLPLTEGICSPVERLTMYESALSQAYMLCSHGAVGYDGQAAATSGASGGTDSPEGRELLLVRVRTYWYTFVHEGITTGLKGGRLHLDGDDMETMQDSISNRMLVLNSQSFRSASKLAVAPINLALACRLINRALTGPSARRRKGVNPDHVKEAWEALEACWEEFDSLRGSSPVAPYISTDDVNHFVDGWKIFLFEAQNVVRNNLEERFNKLSEAQSSAYISDPSHSDPMANSDDALNTNVITVGHLLEIAKGKCDVKTRQIVDIVRRHVGGQMFEWDASLVRDGTYYAATILAKTGGSDGDVALCIQALNELRWAHAKAWDRSADLRREWATSRSTHSNSSTDQIITGWNPASSAPVEQDTDQTGNTRYPDYSTQYPPHSVLQPAPVFSHYPSQTRLQPPSRSQSIGLQIQTGPGLLPYSHPHPYTTNCTPGPHSAHSNPPHSGPRSLNASTDSSLSNSNSPFTSPDIISPTTYEPLSATANGHFPIPSVNAAQPNSGFSSPGYAMFPHRNQLNDPSPRTISPYIHQQDQQQQQHQLYPHAQSYAHLQSQVYKVPPPQAQLQQHSSMAIDPHTGMMVPMTTTPGITPPQSIAIANQPLPFVPPGIIIPSRTTGLHDSQHNVGAGVGAGASAAVDGGTLTNTKYWHNALPDTDSTMNDQNVDIHVGGGGEAQMEDDFLTIPELDFGDGLNWNQQDPDADEHEHENGNMAQDGGKQGGRHDGTIKGQGMRVEADPVAVQLDSGGGA